MAKERNFLTLEVKRFIVKEREKNKRLTQISEAVFREYKVKASKTVVFRICKNKDAIRRLVEEIELIPEEPDRNFTIKQSQITDFFCRTKINFRSVLCFCTSSLWVSKKFKSRSLYPTAQIFWKNWNSFLVSPFLVSQHHCKLGFVKRGNFKLIIHKSIWRIFKNRERYV